MKPRFTLILVLLAGAAGLAAWLATPRPGGTPGGSPDDDRLAPALAQRGDEAGRIEITTGGRTLLLEKRDTGWVLPEHGAYPAEEGRVRSLVTTLSEMRKEEAKTGDPALHERLGVQWPDPGTGEVSPSGASAIGPTLVRVLDGSGGPIAEIVLGAASYEAGRARQFARALNEAQSWLVSARAEIPATPTRWMNALFIEIPRERVRRATITHPDGMIVAVSREDSASDFAVEDIPPGLEPISEGLANRVGFALAFVNFTEVRGDPGEEAPGAVEAVYETFAGLRVILRVVPDEGGGWVTATAEGEGAWPHMERFAGRSFRLPGATVESLTRRIEHLLREVPRSEQGPGLDDAVPPMLRPPGDD
jgi:hypothetical protein